MSVLCRVLGHRWTYADDAAHYLRYRCTRCGEQANGMGFFEQSGLCIRPPSRRR